jgi:hypothetical protein
MRDVEVYIKKGSQPEIALSSVMDSNFHVLTSDVSSPQINTTYQTMSGSDGGRFENATFQMSTVTMECLILGHTRSESRLIKAEVYRHFYSRNPVQVRTSLEPAKAMYVMPRPTDIKFEHGYAAASFTMMFDVLEGYRHTPFRSNEISKHLDKLQYGINLDVEKLPDYSFNTDKFWVLNPSDIPIDPYAQHHSLVIDIEGVGRDFKITNTTNNTSITVNETLLKGQAYRLDGIQSSIGTKTDLKTDWGHIVLERGNNNIVITGLKDVKATFSFPFLYF